MCLPLTSNIVWAGAPGDVLLSGKAIGFPNDSVANVTRIVALARSLPAEANRRLAPKQVAQILHRIDVALGR